MFPPVDAKKTFPEIEREILAYWEKEKIFEESVQRRKGRQKYVFYDGPPFANGLPHYGHILAGALKDAVTRYWTMKGLHVPRVNGWDCHGLPVEYEIEKELQLAGKKDIHKLGVAKFNTACRESVFRYTEEWETLMKRMARWVDFEHSYATLQNDYMESIWWVFQQIWNKKMVYRDFKSMHVCPRCETQLSNFEVSLGYKDVTDLSVIWKFPLKKNKNTSLLAWTTTPWSTPGTTGLSIGPDFDYVKIKTGDEFLIAAAQRVDFVMQGIADFTIVEKMKGSQLVGLEYEPIVDDFQKLPEIHTNANVYSVFAADYVVVSEGTGIVTINGSYGEIDMEAAKKNGLPMIMDVGPDGRFNHLLPAYQGLFVKEGEKKLVSDCKKKGRVLRSEPYRHSYPHCWRCDTPLLNYASQGWFIRVTAIKDRLLKNNELIRWVPPHIQHGRFGKWLENVRDWNISRNRFWGAPLPIWECPDGHVSCIGSLKELREKSLGGNIFYVVRHGEAEQNQQAIINTDPAETYHLTEKGRTQAHTAGRELKEHGIDFIFCSPFPRAMETAGIIHEETGVEYSVDGRLFEHRLGGELEGMDHKSYTRSFVDVEERYTKKFEGGESFQEVEMRAIEFINYCNRKFKGKKIVIITHGDVVRALARFFDRLSVQQTFAFQPGFAGIYQYRAGALPLRDSKLDLHKPYIDEIELKCDSCSKPMKRVPEVLDCWFESGAMPYAQLHYPFENKEDFEKNFPAHFIAEGLDQTRGWFYTLHVLATILFDKPAFQNIIVNGILLAANGEKLSKRKKNYPDPKLLFEKHGVDSTRLFLYTSTAPLAEDVRFSEKYVEEIVKKFTLTLWNSFIFFNTYARIDGWTPIEKPPQLFNSLDRWIISEVNVLTKNVTEEMDSYNITRATRPLIEFVDKLSNWYVRRSRRRFWKSENDADKSAAYWTLHAVLVRMSLLLAPFMPMLADAVFKNLTGKKSVHLEDWPSPDLKRIDDRLNAEIDVVRTVVTLALHLRAQKNIKVRQPLSRITVALPTAVDEKLIQSYRDVICDELNIKELQFDSEGAIATPILSVDARKIGPRFGKETQTILKFAKAGDFVINPDHTIDLPAKKKKFHLEPLDARIGFTGKGGFDVASERGILVSLDTRITKELKFEGFARDLIRHVQDMRKKAGYHVADRIFMGVESDGELRQALNTWTEMIRRETLSLEIQEGGSGPWDLQSQIDLDGHMVKIGIRK